MKKSKSVSYSQFFSAYLGNFFEHYDTALFGFLSPFLAPLIFPDHDPLTALILTFAMIPLGMIVRPIGALFFGHMGDRFGRQKALYISLVGMALVSCAIALTPLYMQAGIFSPILFCLGRVLQNFLASGEIMGGAIYLLENSCEKKHDILNAFYSTSTIGGILFASAAVSFLSYNHWMEGGWRILYLLGMFTAIFGFLIRRQFPAEDVIQKPVENTFKIIWNYRKILIAIAVVAGFSYANYSIALVMTNGFVPLVTTYTKAEMMLLNTGLLVLDFCMLPLFGWMASKISREKMMFWTASIVVVTGPFLFLLLPEAKIETVIAVRICFVILGVAFGTSFHVWAQHLVPQAYRYTIVSFGYALGCQLLGGQTAAISLWAYQQAGSVVSVSFYWVLLALLSAVSIVKTRREADDFFNAEAQRRRDAEVFL